MGIPNPRPQAATVSAGAGEVTLYAKLNELAPFLGNITANAVPTVVVDSQAVRQYARRRYPGGPTKTISAHARRRVIEQAKPDQTLPGSNAWIEQTTGTGASRVTLVEQFTYVGTFQDLKDYCKANAEVDFVLRSPAGVPFIINAP